MEISDASSIDAVFEPKEYCEFIIKMSQASKR